MKKAIFATWNNIKGFLQIIDHIFVSAITIMAIILMIVCTIVLVAFTLTQFSISIGGLSSYKTISDWVLGLLGITINNISEEKYISLLASLTGAISVIVTLWFSVVTTLKYIQYKRDLKKRSFIKKESIYIDGIDDLNIMYRYYRKADNVIVFAGDFSWIQDNDDLKNEILRLADEKKISFVSHKDCSVVKKAIKDTSIYSKLQSNFHYDNKMKIKCSLVNVGHSKIFLYKDDRSNSGGNNNVFIVSGRDDADYLLKIISTLCIPFQPI